MKTTMLTLILLMAPAANAASLLDVAKFDRASLERVNDAIGTLEGESRAAVDHSDDNGYEKIELPLGFILKPIAENVGRNIEGAGRESGAGAKVLKGVTGISVRDGVNHGVFGGPNSIFRKPFGL